jgi:hypothetical protein
MKRIIMLSTFAIALGVSVILVGTTATLAKPTPIEFTNTVRGACDFPVLFEGSGRLNELELPGGVTILHGASAKYTLTNLEEPDNQITYTTYTSETRTTLDNGDILSVFTGHITYWGPGTLELLIGQITFVWHQKGHYYELLSTEGQAIDLCAELV